VVANAGVGSFVKAGMELPVAAVVAVDVSSAARLVSPKPRMGSLDGARRRRSVSPAAAREAKK
jgi:hypothetical protein